LSEPARYGISPVAESESFTSELLAVKELKKYYPVRRGVVDLLRRSRKVQVKAIDGVSFTVNEGKIYGLVGESGSGKTTTGYTIMGLETPTSGSIIFQDKQLSVKELKPGNLSLKVRMIFQNPYETFDPRKTLWQTFSEILQVAGLGSRADRRQMSLDALSRAGLRPAESYIDRFPSELSGGQLQRAAIATALVVEPVLLIADEPVSMLDASIRAGVMNLLLNLNRQKKMAILLITHDLSVAWYLCDYLIVMYLGRIAEKGPAEQVLRNPRHPYTAALISASPMVDKTRWNFVAMGEVGSNIDLPKGCRFHPRCPFATDICREQEPTAEVAGDGWSFWCHHPLSVQKLKN
jgi:peptide/nickel transport system ATP-binding protein